VLLPLPLAPSKGHRLAAATLIDTPDSARTAP
jgi:hypothetical protein